MGTASVDDAGWMTYTIANHTLHRFCCDSGHGRWHAPLHSDVTLTFSFSEPRFEDPVDLHVHLYPIP